jgi:uncharacterized coiled-coil protein SlyX
MNIAIELQPLDDLIVANIRPPLTSTFRSLLHTICERLEAFAADNETKIRGLEAQIVTLKQEKENIAARFAALEMEHLKPNNSQSIEPAKPPPPTLPGFPSASVFGGGKPKDPNQLF